jgi:2-methylcitrate dehydratase PrpD
MHDVTIELARRIADASWPPVNDAVHDDAVRCIVNWLGCAIVGSSEAGSASGGPSDRAGVEATALATGERFDLLHVAAIAEAGADALCCVDTHVPSMLSPGAAVGAGLLPLAEHLAAPGSAFVRAYLLGIEVACRAAMCMRTDDEDVAEPLVCNALGVAAACASLAGLDAETAQRALTAAWQRAAARAPSTGEAAAWAAPIGLRAALDARRPDATAGTAAAPSTPECWHPGMAALLDDWGRPWQFVRLAHHAYPCALFLHPVAEACLHLKRAHHLTQRQIAAVEVRIPSVHGGRNLGPDPADARAARHSVEHVAAVALLDGRVGTAQFESARLRSTRVRDLRARVGTLPDADLAQTAAHVRVMLSNGEAVDREVRCALGHPLRPLSDLDLSAKFRTLTAEVLATDQAERLLGLAWNLRALPDMGALVRESIPEGVHEPVELPGSPLLPR